MPSRSKTAATTEEKRPSRETLHALSFSSLSLAQRREEVDAYLHGEAHGGWKSSRKIISLTLAKRGRRRASRRLEKKNSALKILAFLSHSLSSPPRLSLSPPRHGRRELVLSPLCSLSRREMAPKKDANADAGDDASHLSADAVRKMKVGDLRSALEARGLDSKGLKADLVERLLEATGQVRAMFFFRGRETRGGRERREEEEEGHRRKKKSDPIRASYIYHIISSSFFSLSLSPPPNYN